MNSSTRIQKGLAYSQPVETSQPNDSSRALVASLPLWQFDIVEVTGHNLEARGREAVNALLRSGWRLLHVYTLKYNEDGIWRERPMAILGRPRKTRGKQTRKARTAAKSPCHHKDSLGPKLVGEEEL